jgi:TetR/AcrR family transcriptional repressor of lmrAB and yxaGH operons
MRKGDQTRARMVGTTARLLTTQGYHGTGLGQVLAEAHAPKGSLYFHFPGGKEELAAEAVRRSAAEWREAVLAVVTAAPNPLRAIRAVCDLLAQRLEHSQFQDGCPVATIALEAAPTSDVICEATREAYRTWELLIEEKLRAGGLPEARAARLATTMLAAVEGGMVLAKASRSGEPLRRVGAELEALMGAVLASPK